MTKSFITGRGTVLQVGPELGKGGEGSVHELPTSPDLVAKIYHRMPSPQKQAKLRFMAATSDERLLKYAAWPQDTLHVGKNGPVVGFVMPRVTGRTPVHMVYSPAHRRQDHPKAAWDFLLFAARNTAAAFGTLHDHGHIVGDVNQGNVLVGKDSKVLLIDCDSFQINAKGVMHLSEVGVSHFTPPELQGLPSFDGVMRTFNHDNFGLALLVFHILFGGRHPYSGVPLRKNVGEVLETDIKEYRFAYARDAQSRGIGPPPRSIPVTLVPGDIIAMFELAFTEPGARRARPVATQWVSALDGLRRNLRKCSKAAMHVFPSHLVRCPWCDLEDSGVIYFIDVGGHFASGASGFVLSKVWATIETIAPPAPIGIPTVTMSTAPTPLPPGVAGRGLSVVLQILVVGGAIGLLVTAPRAWLLIVIGAWIAWAVARSAGESGRNAERARRRTALEEAQKEFRDLENRCRRECGAEVFATKKQELARLRDEHHGLGAREKREIEGLKASAEARQRQQFLDKFFIDTAVISGVGQAKKAALRSFGVETAADVDWGRVQSVKGFGEVLTRVMVDWKKSCERGFVFQPKQAVSTADIGAVRAKIGARRRVLEQALVAGASELLRVRQEAATKANTLQSPLRIAAHKLAQARADVSLL